MSFCRLQPSSRPVVLTTVPAVATAATYFTATELNYLGLWVRANRLEVAVEAAGSDLADEVAYIGLGFGMTSWVIQRYVGQLSLSLGGDRTGRRCIGWTVSVSSVEEATARISGMLATGWR
jgi:hypothetical protein